MKRENSVWTAPGCSEFTVTFLPEVRIKNRTIKCWLDRFVRIWHTECANFITQFTSEKDVTQFTGAVDFKESIASVFTSEIDVGEIKIPAEPVRLGTDVDDTCSVGFQYFP
jgi:hypothetical protein